MRISTKSFYKLFSVVQNYFQWMCLISERIYEDRIPRKCSQKLRKFAKKGKPKNAYIQTFLCGSQQLSMNGSNHWMDIWWSYLYLGAPGSDKIWNMKLWPMVKIPNRPSAIPRSMHIVLMNYEEVIISNTWERLDVKHDYKNRFISHFVPNASLVFARPGHPCFELYIYTNKRSELSVMRPAVERFFCAVCMSCHVTLEEGDRRRKAQQAPWTTAGARHPRYGVRRHSIRSATCSVARGALTAQIRELSQARTPLDW